MVLPSDVDLSENQIGAAGLQALCAALALNPAVQKMQLRGNRLEEKAAQHLASLLLLHTGLRSLDLSYNQLNDLAGNTWSGQSWVSHEDSLDTGGREWNGGPYPASARNIPVLASLHHTCPTTQNSQFILGIAHCPLLWGSITKQSY